MSLDAVLLGFLDEPRSGYDLKKLLDRTGGHYWCATLTQIYTTLKRLEERELVTVAPAPSSRGPARRLHRRTPAGDRWLAAWVVAGPTFGPVRSPVLAQIVQLHLLPVDDRGRFLRRLQASARERLLVTRAVIARLGAPHRLAPADRARYAGLAMVERRLVADVAWCDEAAALLGRNGPPDPPDPGEPSSTGDGRDEPNPGGDGT